jgi:hypothetical protein
MGRPSRHYIDLGLQLGNTGDHKQEQTCGLVVIRRTIMISVIILAKKFIGGLDTLTGSRLLGGSL